MTRLKSATAKSRPNPLPPKGGSAYNENVEPRLDNGLSMRQERGISALLVEPTIGLAAAAAGCTYEEICRWLKERNFREQLSHHRQQAFGHFLGRAKTAAGEALEIFVKALEDPDARIRIAAAKEISTIAMRAYELIELEQRVSKLERPPIDIEV